MQCILLVLLVRFSIEMAKKLAKRRDLMHLLGGGCPGSVSRESLPAHDDNT
jgi:hypothetical protein